MARDLALALLVAAAVVLSSPFTGQFVGWLRSVFPRQFVVIVGGGLAAALAALLLLGIARIRYGQPWRYGVIAVALVLGAGYYTLVATGNPEIDAVERVHFLEYGLIGLLFYRAWRPAGNPSAIVLPTLAGVAVGTAEEWFQWFIPSRVGELHDVALNLVAVCCGVLFGAGLYPPDVFTWTLRGKAWRRLGIAASAAALVVAAFAHQVHLGYRIAGRDIGSFTSRYDEQQLRALGADRATRWRTAPPATLRPLSREDQYLDEGLWHVRRRNEAWDDDDRVAAWHENRILEEFFAPVLDVPSYVSSTGFRWTPGQHAAAELAHAGSAVDYVSEAAPLPIATWPKWLFWSCVSALVAVVNALCWWAGRRAGRVRVSQQVPATDSGH